MKKERTLETLTFLSGKEKDFKASIFQLNLYLNGLAENQKPYKIDYHTLLMSYKLWKGKDLDEFCYKQTVSHFLLNPDNACNVAREAFFIEIREFLSKN
jgi:hypothetical protein